MYATVSPDELRGALSSGATLIDVRTPAEFQSLHVRGARNMPLDRLDAQELAEVATPLYVVCQKGGRSKQACEKLAAAGLQEVRNVEGGTDACAAAGLPVERGAASVSLERQVRVAAGSLVVLGVALGFFVHPGWLALAAFVGAGLVFAGVTDTCGMGMLLARAPWNQGPSCGGGSCSR